MAFAHASHTDARNSTFVDVHGDQVNIFNGQDSLDKLKPAIMDASKRKECLPHTRTDILKFIVDWVNDPASQQNILWLHGVAGSGKSTLSTTIANIFRESGILGAFLFFDRDVTDRSDPTMVIRTLAHQLASSDMHLGDAIRAVVEKNSSIHMSPLRLQCQRLILDPLSAMTNANPSTVIVLDALDECGAADERENLLVVLANSFVHLPSSIRTIITSRAEIDIYNAFASQHHILVHELDITSRSNSDDILSYFRDRMSLMRNRKRHLHLGTDWPGEDVLWKLVQRASGLFVWASTVSEFINGHDPRRRLDIILNGKGGSSAEAALDTLYKTALDAIDLWDDEDFVADFRSILGVVLVARRPLSGTTIDLLLHLPDDRPSMHTLSLLGCVLQQGPSVRVLHPSFADFLTTETRCRRDIWFFDRPKYHRYLAFRCLDRMDVVLERNMCNMTLSVDQTNESLPEDVSYSCLHWIDHVCTIEDNSAPVVDRLRGFLNHHLLHWFEAMSILKRSRDTIPLLDRLMNWISGHTPHKARLFELVSDAFRFARNFAHSIEEHPLLVYMSALPITPISTPLYQTFHDHDLHPFVSGGFQQSWSPLTQVLVGHSDWVLSVAVSPDGKMLASSSWDESIRVWDTTTGAEIFEMRNQARSVAFSPDGAHLLSGCMDGAIRAWDVTTGYKLFTLHGHEGDVNSVAFSPDGTNIASGSRDRTLLVWDMAKGAIISKLLGHEASVQCVIFSSDGTQVISGSSDFTIRVWDWRTASQILELRGHEGMVMAVHCSPDGTRLVSGADDTTVRVWDTTTGAGIFELREHEQCVNSVAFSPDGMKVVSGSSDGTVRIWDLTFGGESPPSLWGHDDEVMSVAFAPDGTKVMSGSFDKTIRIWDVPVGSVALPNSRGHEYPVLSVAFSSDGSKLVLGSLNGILHVFDAISGAEVLQMRGHRGGILSVNFSPDGQRIISGSGDMTIGVWSAITGDKITPPLRGHEDFVETVVFSPDGTMIASGSTDTTVRLWDANSGALVIVMVGHENEISALVFSPDGLQIVSGSYDKTVRVWDARTGTQVSPALYGHTAHVTSVLFSPNASRIISQSESESLSWDAATGLQIYSTKQSDHRLSGSMYITHDGWIVDSATDRTLGNLSAMVYGSVCAIHERSLAVGTPSGRVFILNFPPALLTIRDTRVAEEGVRKRFKQPDIIVR